MSNKRLQELSLELLDFLSSHDYIDIFEDVYDAQKYLRRDLSNNQNITNNLTDLWIILDESINNNISNGFTLFDLTAKYRLKSILNELKPILFLQENRDLKLNQILVKEDKESFTKNDWDHFHDCYFHVHNRHLNQEEMRELWEALPDDLKEESLEWGMNDTVWRENFIDWLEENL
jgi:hypothetical protein